EAMTTLAALMTSPGFVVTGWTVAVVLCETIAVALLLAIWELLRPATRMRGRYVVYMTGFALVVLLALLTPLGLRVARMLEITGRDRPTTASASSSPHIVVPPSNGPVSGNADSRFLNSEVATDLLAGAAGVLWAAAVLVLTVRLAGGALLAVWVTKR